jgi:hypothetical protein
MTIVLKIETRELVKKKNTERDESENSSKIEHGKRKESVE